MPETRSGQSLPIVPEPRKKPGPKPPKAPPAFHGRFSSRSATSHKHFKQRVLIWLINHRYEDVGCKQGEGAVAGVERLPHEMPDGSEKWFRGPTFAEAANHWNVPVATVEEWWEDKLTIFDGLVPSSIPPLIPFSQRDLNVPRPPKPPPPSPPPPPREVVPRQPPAPAPGLPPHHHRHGVPVPPSPTAMLYPQAVQPVGPPLHPLYRANFALGEVSREVAHMLQNQHNLYLENLLRATSLAQSLVNDLVEAHQVLLSPENYPQYYPSTPPQPYSYQSSLHQPQPPPQPQPQPPGRAPAPYPAPPPPPRQQQQLAGPLSRTSDGRYVVIQPNGNPPEPTQFSRKRRYASARAAGYQDHQPSQQAGEHRWLVGRGSPATTQAPLQQQQQLARQSGCMELNAGQKRSYASRDGPGMTAERPIELEDDDDHPRDGREGREKRRATSVNAGENGEAGGAQEAGDGEAAKETNGGQAAAQRDSGSTNHTDVNGSGSTQPDGSVFRSAGNEQGSTTNQAETAAATKETAEEAGEAAPLEDATAANGETEQDETVQDGEDELSKQLNAELNDSLLSTENGIGKGAGEATITELGGRTDGEGSLSTDFVAASTEEGEPRADGDQPAIEAQLEEEVAGETEEAGEAEKAGEAGEAGKAGEAGEAEKATEAQEEEVDMADAPIAGAAVGASEEDSPISIED